MRARFEILTLMLLEIEVSWNVIRCWLVNNYWLSKECSAFILRGKELKMTLRLAPFSLVARSHVLHLSDLFAVRENFAKSSLNYEKIINTNRNLFLFCDLLAVWLMDNSWCSYCITEVLAIWVSQKRSFQCKLLDVSVPLVCYAQLCVTVGFVVAEMARSHERVPLLPAKSVQNGLRNSFIKAYVAYVTCKNRNPDYLEINEVPWIE
jgi:hypothetical protein